MKAWELPRSPPRPSPLYPSSSPVTFTSRRVPGAPDCSSPLSPPPPAGVGSGLRARHPPPLHLGQRTQPPAAPCTAPGTASCSRTPSAALFFPGCHPPALHPLSSLSWRTPLCCGPETLLPFSALGTVVICDCPLTRGTQTPWTCLSRREHVLARRVRGRGGTGQLDAVAARVQSPRLRSWTPAASPPPCLPGLDTCAPPTDAAPPQPPHVLPLHGHGHPIGWTPGVRGF